MLPKATVPILMLAAGAGFFAAGFFSGSVGRDQGPTKVAELPAMGALEQADPSAMAKSTGKPSETSDADDKAEPSEHAGKDTQETGHEKDEAHKEATGEGEDAEEVAEEQGRVLSLEPLPEGDGQPWRVVRHLQLLQDAIARGEPDAVDNYRRAIVIAGRHLAGLGPPVWNHQRNLDAAAIYLLIGGDPQVAEAAIARTELSEEDLLPLNAARAYAGRELRKAAKLFEQLPLSSLAPSARGQFALAHSMTVAAGKPDDAVMLLDRARQLAPGTLIEEAALRRLVPMAGQAADIERFSFLTRNYLERFRQSGYYGDFVRVFAIAMMQLPNEHQDRLVAELTALSAGMPMNNQLPVLAFVAKRATVEGKTKLASWAARRGLEELPESSKFHAQFVLYLGAAEIIDPMTNAEARRLLEGIDVEKLDGPHRILHGAVVELGRRITGASVGLQRVQEILKAEQQPFPGDDPEPAVTDEELRAELDGHQTVVRMKALDEKLRALGLGL